MKMLLPEIEVGLMKIMLSWKAVKFYDCHMLRISLAHAPNTLFCLIHLMLLGVNSRQPRSLGSLVARKKHICLLHNIL